VVDRLIENGRCYWNGNGCGKKLGNENIRVTTHSREYDRKKQTENVEYFSFLVSMIRNYGRCHGKSSIQQEANSFHQQMETKFKEETIKMLHLEHSFVRF
jgi:hypothetical protein